MLRIHQPPIGESVNNGYTELKVNGQKTEPWFCRVSAVPYDTVWPGFQRPLDQTEIAAFLSLETDSPVEIVAVLEKPVLEAVVRPLSKKAEVKVLEDGHTVCAKLPACGNYTLEINGTHNALHIFANPVNDFGVNKDDPNVLYYAPGVYELGDIELEDGQTLFVDGGAVLYGSVNVINKKNVKILGYGVIDGSREVRTNDTLLIAWQANLPEMGLALKNDTYDLRDEESLRRHLEEEHVLNGCVHMYSCRDCEINGIIARDSSTFAYILANCERVNVEWAKTIGMWRYNSDGIDTINSRYIRVANCFLRDFDDCMVIKGIKGWDKENQHHISVTGCTIWGDWGSCLELGAETCADEYYDILWDDCDIIHAAHVFMRLHNSDRAWVHNMLVRNIRCEYSKYDLEPVYQHDMNAPYPESDKPYYPMLINSPIYDGPYSKDHIIGRVSDLRFENIQTFADTQGVKPFMAFEGYDEEHSNVGVVVENLTLNGKRLKEADVQIKLGKWDTLSFK